MKIVSNPETRNHLERSISVPALWLIESVHVTEYFLLIVTYDTTLVYVHVEHKLTMHECQLVFERCEMKMNTQNKMSNAKVSSLL